MMNIIVDIPENIYTAITTKNLRKYPKFEFYDMCIMSDRVRNGVPLEKELEDIKEEINFIVEKCLPNNIAEEYEVKGLKTSIKIIDKHIKEINNEQVQI